jgi:TrbC/VIRB2 pilin
MNMTPATFALPASTFIGGSQRGEQARQWLKAIVWSAVAFVATALLLVDPAFATGTGTGGTAGARVQTIVSGWQTIIVTAGVGFLIIAWSFFGYQFAMNGKTMKDIQGPLIGSSIAGLAPVLVGWMFS